jgi:hypothetical protein
MTDELNCWRCGASLEKLSLPLSRLDECPDCGNYLHVCRMCSFYDPNVAKACREDDAEEVKEKERANFCDYFKPRVGAHDAAISAAEQKARGELDTLFGDATEPDDVAASDESLKEAESLFGNGKKPD